MSNFDDQTGAAGGEKLEAAIEVLRARLNLAEYERQAGNLIVLKCVNDAFEERRAELATQAHAELQQLEQDAERAALSRGEPAHKIGEHLEHLRRAWKPRIDPESPEAYTGDGVSWVPREARWDYLQAVARHAEVGAHIDAAVAALVHDDRSLTRLLSREPAGGALDDRRLGELIDLVSTIAAAAGQTQELKAVDGRSPA